MPDNTWSRRSFLGALSVAASQAAFPQGGDLLHPASHHVLLGTQGKISRGIYAAPFDPATGALGPMTLAAEIPAPTFLALHRSAGRTVLYTVSEVDSPAACVAAFVVTGGEPRLTPLNRQPSEGTGPTHLSLTHDGRALAVANYGGGSVTTYRLAADGTISAPVSHLRYAGSGPNHDRQGAPHAHSAQFSPDGRFLLVNDLGLDRIDIYRVDDATAAITPATPPFWTARPGAGPRHVAFHPNGHWLYSVNELDSTVDQLQWNASAGTLTPLSRISTLPPGIPPNSTGAGEILCSPDGRHLYVGNRVISQTLAAFEIDPASGALTLAQITANGGKTTRHFALDPTGRWMLLANQDSGSIVVLARDPATGRLSEPRHTYPLDSAMFTLFLP